MADEVKNNTWDDDVILKTQQSMGNLIKKTNEQAVKKIEKAASEGKTEITMEVPKHVRQQFVDQWNAEHLQVIAHHYALHKHITFEWEV